MALDVFLADALRCVTDAPNEYVAARCTKTWLQRALVSDDFVYGLSEFLISCLEVRGTHWRLRPLPLPSSSPICIRLLVWPPRYANEPHEHTGWTVAGVLLNRLEGRVLERSSNAQSLETKYQFTGTQGDVGILDPPCIHQLSNPTVSITLSVHIFASAGGAFLNDHQDHHHGDLSEDNVAEDRYTIGLRQRLELALVEILGQGRTSQFHGLFDRLFEYGSPKTKLAICQATARTHPYQTAQRLAKLSEFTDDLSALRLRELSSRIAAESREKATGDG